MNPSSGPVHMSRKRNKVKIYYQNIRGMRGKVNDIRSKILTSDYDIVTLTETWLNDSFHSTEFFSDTYFVERCDRQIPGVERGGGVLIALKNYISYSRIYDWERVVPFDNIWISIKCENTHDPLFINVVYIPPSSRYDQYDKYFDNLNEIICNAGPNAKFLILGDFNMGASITWQTTNQECLVLSYEGNISTELMNTLSLNDLKQFNYLRNKLQRILDYALSNIDELELYDSSTSALSIIDPHHIPFCVSLSSIQVKYITPQKTNKLNFFKANYV